MHEEESRVKMQAEDDERSLTAMNARLGTQEAQVPPLRFAHYLLLGGRVCFCDER